MSFVQAIAAGFANYVSFSGRACRSEYWYWALFIFIVALALLYLDIAIFPDNDWQPLGSVWSLVTFLPSLSISVRRLHDIDRTGWWVLIALTIIGIVLLIVWACVKGTTGSNRFGPDPLGAAVTPP